VLSLSSTDALLSAIGTARDVELSTFILPPGRVLTALEAACRRGVHVTVRIEGAPCAGPPEGLAKLNANAVAQLARAGADARLVHLRGGDGPAMHLKAAIVDGAMYLDDRNWPSDGNDTILRDTNAADIGAVRGALSGGGAPPLPSFWTTKAEALRGESATIGGAQPGDEVCVESESFGKGSGVYGDLRRLARSGVHCRLIVARTQERTDPRERAALRALAADGVEVRVGSAAEKFAFSGAQAWIGSANATTTYYDGDQRDWGLRTDAPEIVTSLEQRFNACWSRAKSFAAITPGDRPSSETAMVQ
jgi:phosphatidylserine/phosphatidylglycerophosphate/cardiolipin synthase-like enzyme